MHTRDDRCSASISTTLPAGDCAHDEKRLGPFCNRIRQGSIRWFVGDVFAAREKSDQWPALFCFVVPDGAAQHWIFFFNRVDYCAHRRRAVEIDVYFITNLRKRAQMMGEDDANHVFLQKATKITKVQTREYSSESRSSF